MEQDALRSLLERLDDPVFAEYPGGWTRWNQHAAEVRFLTLVKALEARLGCPSLPEPFSGDPEREQVREQTLLYETGKHIQDASFHGQILLPRSLLTEPARRVDYHLSLRTSNFGLLATVYDDDTLVRPQALSTMRIVLDEQGYLYVPTAVLVESYTGRNPGVSGFRDWGMRYFDWI
jgi:hypothetical protein